MLEEDTEQFVPILVEFIEKNTVKFVLSYGGLYCKNAWDLEYFYTKVNNLWLQKVAAIIFSAIC